MSGTYYILKIEGKTKIPDYVQLRDEHFTLLAYFRADRPEKALDKCGLHDQADEIMKIVKEVPFGMVKKITLS